MFRTDVVIAKVDSTENEIEGQDVQGFPTLKLFKKETNEIIDYDGNTFILIQLPSLDIFILCTVNCVLCTVYCELCTVYCKTCTV